jgi:hypothetical protein
MKKSAMGKIATAGQENIKDRAFKFFGKNFYKNYRGFVVIGQK